MERFLGFVQGDGLSALLLDVELEVVLEVAADTLEATAKEKKKTQPLR